YLGARKYNLHAHHLIHLDEAIKEQSRFYMTAASVFNSDARHKHALSDPFHGILASCTETSPDHLVGYAAVGPIMYTFAKYILQEVEELKKTRNNVKVLFLMRDAQLPYLACEALAGHSIGTRVRISRFVALAA